MDMIGQIHRSSLRSPAAAPTRRSRYHHRSPRPPELQRRPEPDLRKGIGDVGQPPQRRPGGSSGSSRSVGIAPLASRARGDNKSGERDEVAQRGTSARASIMSKSGKVLRYDLTATDGSGRRLVQYALPGSDFETAESLETDGLIKLEFTNGEWTTTRVFAPDDMRVVVWQFNVNEQDRVHGKPLHFPNVKKRWFYFDESTVTVGRA